jgi:hypothetical protein
MGAQLAIQIHLFTMSLTIVLTVAYIVHGLIYPRVSGEIPLGPHQVDYKVGRIPFVNSGKFFINLYRHWWWVENVDEFLSTTGKQLRYETKSYWAHILDCGLLYPALFVYVWNGYHWMLFK